MKRTFLVLLIAAVAGCDYDAGKQESNSFTGLWSLHIMEKQDPETGKWSEWRNGMQGYLLYDNKGHMSLHLITEGYEETDLRFPNFVDTISIEALRHLTNSYVYFAKYKVDKENRVIEHARVSHSNPGEWNKVVRRRYTFKEDTLILQPVEAKLSGLRLKWVRKE